MTSDENLNAQQRAWADVAAALADGDDPGVLIERFESQAEEREEQARVLGAQGAAFRQLAASVRVLSGRDPVVRERDAAPGFEWGHTISTPERPAGMDAIRIIMRDEGGVWTTRKLMEELERRGWEFSNARSPLRATEAALGRLHSVKGEIERVRRGEYRYIQKSQASPLPAEEGRTSRSNSQGPTILSGGETVDLSEIYAERPRGRDAIRRVVLASDRERTWTPKRVAAEIESCGWKMSMGSIHNNLSVMARDRELERVGVGRYRRGPRFQDDQT